MSKPATRLWYVISDIHGNYKAFRNLLLHAQLIDENSQWIGGATRLFLLGDYVTTCPNSKQAIDLIRSLERYAPGQVISLFGNHELFLSRAIHDSRYRREWLANPEHWQTIASWATASEELGELLSALQINPISTQKIERIYQAAAKANCDSSLLIKRAARQWEIDSSFSSRHLRQAWRVFLRNIEKDGTLEWIEQLPVAYRQDEWGFFHAGPPTGFSGSIADLNKQFSKRLRNRQFDHPLLEPRRSAKSPIGTRRWWVEAPQVDRLFNQFEIERCVFGHDPRAILPRGRLGQVWNKVISADASIRAGIEGMIRIDSYCVDAIYTDSAISILQRIYPQEQFLREERLINGSPI